MPVAKKRLVSGIKPSGELHIGNYFGAIRQFIELQENHESYVFVADYHALNFIQNAKELKEHILHVAKAYMAVGLNTAKVVLFKQSDIPEHTELAWIFDTITTVPYLMRAHAYKDAEAKGNGVSVGTFNYPMLMAADILLYEPDVVPVGHDQKQHVEYARDTAEKFNHIFGDTFTLPKEKIIEAVSVVPGIDGRKMSKSYGNTIPLFATRETIQKQVMSIVTDSSGDRPENVYAIHKLFKSEAELHIIYDMNRGKYKTLKEILIEDIEALVTPMRERYESISDAEVIEVLKEGAEMARKVALKKMELVRERVGVALY